MELGMGEIMLILLVALLVYGGRLPQVAAAVGRSVAELRRGLRDTTDLVRNEVDELADLDPRRAVRRAWEARPQIPADPGVPSESDVSAPADPPSQERSDDELATEDISLKSDDATPGDTPKTT